MALWALEQKGGMGDTLRLLPLLWCENTKYKIISNEKKTQKRKSLGLLTGAISICAIGPGSNEAISAITTCFGRQ